ncbi:site-specific integrase [Marinobacter salarius]|uniref:site-specific integrase n=1 Tax=Marinobacter salarius TaxID=1420917 RepID=UPI00125F5EF9|nr:site-specific integrase [Marinobacter salarius]
MALRMATPIRDKYGTYICRKGVPEELRPYVGKRELKRSLKTKDPKEAKLACFAVYNEFEEILANARRQANGETVLTSKDIEILADRWLENKLDHVERNGSYRDWYHWEEEIDPATGRTVRLCESPLLSSIAEASESENSEALPDLIHAIVGDDLQGLLKSRGLPTSTNSDEYRQLSLRIAAKIRPLIHHAAHRERGRYSEPAESRASEPLKVEAPKTGVTISEAWNIYLERIGRQEGKATAISRGKDYEASIHGLAEFLGNPPINEVTPNQIRDYRDFLWGMPVRPPKAVKELPIRERPAKAAELGLKTISRATIRNRLMHVSSLFVEAMDVPEARVQTNPVQGVKMPPRNAREDMGKVKEFTPEELDTIFHGDWFSTTRYNTRDKDGAAAVWLPLILYYTGARREEIAAMRASDIRKVQGVWVFDIRAHGEDRTIKNAQSSRTIPIHQDLLKLGLLEYRDSILPGGNLWPTLRDSKNEGKGYLWARSFRAYLSGLGVNKAVSPAHGFRHRFTTALRDQGVDESTISRLTGHANKSQTSQYGTFSPLALSRAIEELPSVPGLERTKELLRQPVKLQQARG